ncbi:MFS transporter [Stappia sp. BW2]|uniref:MFS transporter n=1 Tax=Stappia sp. BW2 TaxID=2592622 RepID=UPI0011DED597|nr:MFS transporter [Stappia sp. BW2]TYC72380.1 MFS transporter [Stappia sp. BW2]
MLSLLQLPRQALLILLLQFTNSLGVSALVPLMSFFIVEGLGAAPWQVGLYSGLVMPLTLTVNRWAGERLDNRFPVKSLLIVSVIAYITLAALLTQVSSLLMLIILIAPLMSLSNMGSGIVFTFGRLYAEQQGMDVARVNSWLRMMVSLAWMIGPAVSFSIVAAFGFATAFLCAFTVGIVYLLLWYIVIPADFRSSRERSKSTGKAPINWGLQIAGMTCLGFVITNSLFVSAMPLFFVQETHLPGATPGLALSVKCLLEVFVIFGSVRLAERIGIRQVLMLSACLAAVSMVLFAQVTALWQVLAIAVLEGTYYGLFAGVAISFVQSFAPDRPGRATAVYMNSLFLGGMIGSVSMGFIASAASFQTVLYTAALSATTALVVLVSTLKVQPKPIEEGA